MNKSIDHALADGMLHIEQIGAGDGGDVKLLKFIYLHSASQNRYEIMLNQNDIDNLCPLFTAYKELYWKVFSSKPTVSLKVSTLALQWKISISFEDEQIININLDLMTGEEHAHINRRFQMMAEENQDMKKQMEDMKKQIDRLKEVVLRSVSCAMGHAAGYSRSYSQHYVDLLFPWVGLPKVDNISSDPHANYNNYKKAIFP